MSLYILLLGFEGTNKANVSSIKEKKSNRMISTPIKISEGNSNKPAASTSVDISHVPGATHTSESEKNKGGKEGEGNDIDGENDNENDDDDDVDDEFRDMRDSIFCYSRNMNGVDKLPDWSFIDENVLQAAALTHNYKANIATSTQSPVSNNNSSSVKDLKYNTSSKTSNKTTEKRDFTT